MADENQNKQDKAGNILAAARGELEGQRVKALKADVKKLLEDLYKAEEVVEGIKKEIVAVCEKSGLSEEKVLETLRNE